MRKITHIVIHAAATKKREDIGVTEIRQWHKLRGFKDVGYHYIIRRNGIVEKGRPEEKIGAHVQGHNATSIGICLVGGLNDKGLSDFNFTHNQMASLFTVVEGLKSRYPKAVVKGHRDFTTLKACPCFDAGAWFNG